MPTNLLLAPVGAGKTELALAYLERTLKQAEPFAPIWVLLPSQRQQDAFRARLAERERRVYFNIHFFNFYSLYAHLLDAARQPQRRLEEAARLALLRSILIRLHAARQLEVFGSIAHTPGFVRNVADFIYELKQNLNFPETFEQAAQTAKDGDIARIYREYQRTLQQHNLVDREGEGWLALSLVESKPDIAAGVSLLLVDGYDQFTPLQAQLLTVLASRARDTLVTLTRVARREHSIGRRFEKSYKHLQQAHFDRRVYAQLRLPEAVAASESRHPALKHLLEHGFFPDAQPQPSNGAVEFIEAPDPAQEVAAVLRRVKRRLLAGSKPEEILVVLRDWERYRAHFPVYSRDYGLRLAAHYGDKLAENPAIIALMQLLDLHAKDFRRRDLLDVLRSPYFAVHGLTEQQIEWLDRISQAFLVTGGRRAWLEAVGLAAQNTPEDDEQPLLNAEQARQLLMHLTAFFDAVTPPQQAPLGEYVRWVEQLIGPDPQADEAEENEDAAGSLQVLRQIRAAWDDRLVDRDLSAMACLKRVLRSLVTARELLKALGDPDVTLRREAFLDDLRTAVAGAEIEAHPNRAGRVLVTAVTDARGLPHRHVFILGLSEGLFPIPVPEDPLYLDSERQRLAQAGITLETQAERAADDGLFYELISLAHDSLTLSRPSVREGVPWPASHLWREVRRAFSDIEVQSFHVGAVVPAAEAASFNEVALSVADGLNEATPTTTDVGFYNWLVTAHDAHWSAIVRGRQIEQGRMSRRPHNRYSGRLSDPDLIAQVARLLGPARVWSASQFNDYGVCGFRFFARRLLKLDVLEEPEDGMDAAQYGTLNHDILENVYRRLQAEGATITPEYAQRAVEILYEVGEARLRDAPQRLGFRATALWHQEARVILRRLEALIRLDFSGDGPVTRTFGAALRQPYRLEAPFGASGGEALLDIGGERLKVQGVIDRMDRQGSRVIVVDYKSGGTKIESSEMEGGRNFQMMLYLLAASQLLAGDPSADAPDEVAGGLFWHLSTRETSGEIHLDDDGLQSLQKASEHLSRYLALGRKGDFAARPNKLKDGKCSHYCEFREMCRVSLMNRYKT